MNDPAAPVAPTLASAFAAGHKAFIPFVTCGDPDLETTRRIVHALVDAGADLIELGIPFSDPTAEGPVIQAANARALSGGVTTDCILAFAAELRREIPIPLAFMTYANVVYAPGPDRFAARCAAAGVTGLILPDVPYEERAEFEAPCRAHGIDLVSMVAPTSADRIAAIARAATGFLYVVSSLGVTGERTQITTDLSAILRTIRAASTVPAAIGFGISTPDQARAMASISDGAIVGSALVRLIATHGRDAPGPVYDLASSLASAIHSA